MEPKYSPTIQAEIHSLVHKVQIYEKYFTIRLEFFIDGWALYLDEKNIYPRLIVIFKDSSLPYFSIRSYEIQNNNFDSPKYIELYANEEVQEEEDVLKELRALVYGKDILTHISKKYFNKILE